MILSGLKEGEHVIVPTGIQRVRPGIAGEPRSAAGAARQAARRTERAELSMISAVFVDRPRLAIVIAIVMTLAGADLR